MKTFLFALPLLMSVLLVSCDNDDDIMSQDPCGDSAEIIDLSTFLPSGLLLSGDPSISDNCLTFEYGASGCDLDNWIVKMYIGEDIAYTNPPSRNALVVLENPEACLAFFQDQKEFDLSELQSQGDVLLIFNDSTQVLYQP